MPYCIIQLGFPDIYSDIIEDIGIFGDYITFDVEKNVIKDPDYIKFIESMEQKENINESELQAFEKKYSEIAKTICDSYFHEEFSELLSNKEHMVMKISNARDIESIFDIHYNKLKKYNIILLLNSDDLYHTSIRNKEKELFNLNQYIKGNIDHPPRISYKSKPEVSMVFRKMTRKISPTINGEIKYKSIRVIIKGKDNDTIFDKKTDLSYDINVKELFEVSYDYLFDSD